MPRTLISIWVLVLPTLLVTNQTTWETQPMAPTIFGARAHAAAIVVVASARLISTLMRSAAAAAAGEHSAVGDGVSASAAPGNRTRRTLSHPVMLHIER
jgi:hypothetical protein